MKNIFLSLGKLIKLLKNHDIETVLKIETEMGICSIGDILFLPEVEKKSHKISLANSYSFLNNKFQETTFIAELDRLQLEKSMFDFNEETDFWTTAIDADLEPRLSLVLLSLKLTEYTWWENSIFEDCIEEYC